MVHSIGVPVREADMAGLMTAGHGYVETELNARFDAINALRKHAYSNI